MLTLALVGRPNVGKSTLFNLLVGKRLAIVHDRPGVTRDWREAQADLFDRTMRIIDTAGLEDVQNLDSLPAHIRAGTDSVLARADVVLFLLDGRAGVTPIDAHFAAMLRRLDKPVIVALNKCENERATAAACGEAHALGLGTPLMISAAHGVGLEDIYHALTPYTPPEKDKPPSDPQLFKEEENIDALEGLDDYIFPDVEEGDQRPIKLAIVGRPNVGKSTLLNALLGTTRAITSPEAGTTRDPITADWYWGGRQWRLVDTAGLRRRAKVIDVIEKMAGAEAYRAIRLAQVVALVLDAGEGLEKQDLQIASHVLEEGRALVLILNKWDTVTDKAKTLENVRYRMEKSMGQAGIVPLITLSALTGRNVQGLLRGALDIYGKWNARTSTGKLNRWLAGMEEHHPPPLVGGRSNRLKYMTQVKTRPPTFALWVGRKEAIPEEYMRYLTHGLRRDFGMEGIPVRLVLRTSKNPYA